MKIYITRHGETQWNKEVRMQGWQDSNLTQKGIDNAKKLGESLKDIRFDYIYCSPLGRAVDTANYIRGNKDTEIIKIESLREMGFGAWEGMENEKIKELYPLQQFNFWKKPHLYESVDGESFDELNERVKRVFYDIINNTSGENILIVTHTVVIKAIFAMIKNYSLEDFWSKPFMYDTCLTILEVANKKIEIVLEADISHLNKD
jgi:broad specificity phosphatase PhoE